MALLRSLAVVAALSVAGAASAHVAADPGQAMAGSYQAVRFRVGHGCSEGAATTALRIEIPAGMASVKAQPKPGWKLGFERQDGRIVAVTWRGRLAADEFDEFALFLHLPEQPASLAFPAIQTCGRETARWTGDDAKHPAPTLRLVAPEPSPHAGHEHH